VNFASRLEGANKAYLSRILISGATAAAALGTYVETREIDRLIVVGKTEPQQVFEIMGRKGALTPNQEKLRDRFSEGLEAYRAQNWETARTAFDGCIEVAPNDRPASTFLKRVEILSARPPAKNWDGVWVMDQK
jgi:adenylate cyclase